MTAASPVVRQHWAGMFHVFPILVPLVSEAATAVAQIGRFCTSLTRS